MVKTRSNPPAPQPRSRRYFDVLGLILFGLGAASMLWLGWSQNAPIPDAVASWVRMLAGSGALALPMILLFVGAMFLIGYEKLSFSHSTAGCILLFFAFVAWRHVALYIDPALSTAPAQANGGPTLADPNWGTEHLMSAGGYSGAVFGTILIRLFGHTTSYILLVVMGCISAVLIVDKPFIEMVRSARRPAAAGLNVAKQGVAVVRQGAGNARERRGPKIITEPIAVPASATPSEEVQESGSQKRKSRFPSLPTRRTPRLESDAESGKPQTLRLPLEEPEEELVSLVKESDPPLEMPDHSDFRLPPLTVLKEAAAPKAKKNPSETDDKIKILESTLDQFGIGANVVQIANGPTITRYEVQLAPGIKVSKIVSLADNLAMALAAIDVRVEAPIPGKSAIGIEVPNTSTTMVTLREVLDVPEFKNASSKLTFALGKDVTGVNRYADLTKMPHLLIGGSTNSGKSVCLNVLIASMLYRATPRELQFLMIDPKRVELSLWDGIPHLMHPVIKDVKQAAGIFRSAIKEMERRYDMFARIGTRNIDGYNERMVVDKRDEDKLPYLVIVVDELADLMMQAAAEVETSICRLAQLARATGIHLVIATQRPSVDVITGLIKANISSRVAFAVSSQVDSRTILDMSGAERLIGRGDMLFMPIDASKPVRIQGCYLSEQETNELVNYLKSQERPNYTMVPAEVGSAASHLSGSDGDGEDEFFEQAVRLVVTNGQASTSMLQRKFKIGYTRAARLVDMMQERGIVGPLDGAKPREILVSRDEIDRMFRGEFAGD